MNIEEIKTDIIPVKQFFYHTTTDELLDDAYDYNSEELDLKSIAFYAASGFFFGNSTFYKDIKVIPPATQAIVDSERKIISMKKYWEWFYDPVLTELDEISDVFGKAFEENISRAMEGKKVLFPLSGGMDSRTIAAAIPDQQADLLSYAYEFENGVKETWYGNEIAKVKGFPFKSFTIPKGYLWDKLDELNKTLNFYSEFTHSRQIALMDELEKMGEIFLLGHGGEVFRAPSFEKAKMAKEIPSIIYNVMVKESGRKLGERLWALWGLSGSFDQYVFDLIEDNLKEIRIEDGNAKIRAFMFAYIASRKNQVNINIFGRKRDIHLPFIQENILNIVCRTREDLLTKRKVQIHYIKRKSSKLAQIPLQNTYPLNLYNSDQFETKRYLPVRALLALSRRLKEKISGHKTITRNWENQFLGEKNDSKLQKYLFKAWENDGLLPESLLKDYYHQFRENSVENIAPFSMLLTLKGFFSNRVLADERRENLMSPV